MTEQKAFFTWAIFAFLMTSFNTIKTYPEFLLQTGDLVVFQNTAAYMMDFTESETDAANRPENRAKGTKWRMAME